LAVLKLFTRVDVGFAVPQDILGIDRDVCDKSTQCRRVANFSMFKRFAYELGRGWSGDALHNILNRHLGGTVNTAMKQLD
jgi:hypothetical protein